ncbi:hypothetical protein MNVI_01770 [Mycobacterium noviomagense]|nr:hypothetical protein MNVI_01770 [Mycobacterium noviomagense]
MTAGLGLSGLGVASGIQAQTPFPSYPCNPGDDWNPGNGPYCNNPGPGPNGPGGYNNGGGVGGPGGQGDNGAGGRQTGGGHDGGGGGGGH